MLDVPRGTMCRYRRRTPETLRATIGAERDVVIECATEPDHALQRELTAPGTTFGGTRITHALPRSFEEMVRIVKALQTHGVAVQSIEMKSPRWHARPAESADTGLGQSVLANDASGRQGSLHRVQRRPLPAVSRATLQSKHPMLQSRQSLRSDSHSALAVSGCGRS